MKILSDENQLVFVENDSHKGGTLIGDRNGATNGFMTGISYYHLDVYGEPGIHNDQEALYVIEGHGKVKVGNDEFSIKEGSAFLVPPNTYHIIKKNRDSVPIKVLWAHGAQ